MNFEWDEIKNKQNIRRHGFDLADGQQLFIGGSPFFVSPDSRRDYGEERWQGIGILQGVLIAVVVFTERVDDTIRIISLR